jgi:hypothetical protein
VSLLQIDRGQLEPEVTLELYRAAVRWAAARGTAFEITIEPDAYDDPRDVARLQALGQPVAAPQPATRPLRSDGAIYVRGVPDERFVRAMTEAAAPARARAGDESPVDVVIIYARERALYTSYDHGTVQILDIDDGERRDLERAFREGGLPATAMFPVA